jgi:hypothetical protein
MSGVDDQQSGHVPGEDGKGAIALRIHKRAFT